MIILPAIDLQNGRCVRLRQGRADDATVYSDDPADVIRVACVGDSISLQPNWPDRLAHLLGPGYDVKAFAANGTSVLRTNLRSVWKLEIGHGSKDGYTLNAG